jgi:hypothetical protein
MLAMPQADHSPSPYLLSLAKLERQKAWYRLCHEVVRVILIVMLSSVVAGTGLYFA